MVPRLRLLRKKLLLRHLRLTLKKKGKQLLLLPLRNNLNNLLPKHRKPLNPKNRLRPLDHSRSAQQSSSRDIPPLNAIAAIHRAAKKAVTPHDRKAVILRAVKKAVIPHDRKVVIHRAAKKAATPHDRKAVILRASRVDTPRVNKEATLPVRPAATRPDKPENKDNSPVTGLVRLPIFADRDLCLQQAPVRPINPAENPTGLDLQPLDNLAATAPTREDLSLQKNRRGWMTKGRENREKALKKNRAKYLQRNSANTSLPKK